MDELLDLVVGYATSAGGAILYKDILAQFPPEKRGQLPRILKEAKARNLLTVSVQLVDGQIVHTYTKV